MENRFRRDNRNDPMLQTILNDPAVTAALDERTHAARHRMRQKVEKALEATDARKLKSWVVVAVWEDAEGAVTENIASDDHTDVLEVRSMLHGAIWTAGHNDGH